MRVAGRDGAARAGPVVGAVLAAMARTAACRGRPRGAARARFPAGSGWAQGAAGGVQALWEQGPLVRRRAGLSGTERSGGTLAGCPAELATGSPAANKAALMETCCCTKAERSDSWVFYFFPQKGS